MPENLFIYIYVYIYIYIGVYIDTHIPTITTTTTTTTTNTSSASSNASGNSYLGWSYKSAPSHALGRLWSQPVGVHQADATGRMATSQAPNRLGKMIV